jgi:hypothetical protein
MNAARERHAFLEVGEAVRAFHNGDHCAMDTGDLMVDSCILPQPTISLQGKAR